jgi:hypothetical protein
MEDTYTSRRQKKQKVTTKRKEISIHHQIPTAMAIDHLSLSLSLSLSGGVPEEEEEELHDKT